MQLTDYENAAFAVFIVLLTRAIMTMGLNFYLPITKVSLSDVYSPNRERERSTNRSFRQVDENMHRAHRRDAVNSQKFYFRKNLFDPKPGHGCDPSLDTPLTSRSAATTNGVANGNGHSRSATSTSCASSTSSDVPTSPCCSSHAPSRAPSPTLQVGDQPFGPIEDEYDEFTINEIINGSPARSFPGLLGVVRQYLDGLEISSEVRTNLDKSLDLVAKRADGSLVTTATWMRNFVQSHPAYKHDSVVSQEINYDLVRAVDRIEKGELDVPELLPTGWRDNYVQSRDAFKKCCGAAVNGLGDEDEGPALKNGAKVDVDCGIALGKVVEAK